MRVARSEVHQPSALVLRVCSTDWGAMACTFCVPAASSRGAAAVTRCKDMMKREVASMQCRRSLIEPTLTSWADRFTDGRELSPHIHMYICIYSIYVCIYIYICTNVYMYGNMYPVKSSQGPSLAILKVIWGAKFVFVYTHLSKTLLK